MSESRTTAIAPSLTGRVRLGLRQRSNWLQLLRFGIVGGLGYAVNLAVFALAVHGAGTSASVGAVLAFVVALMNNFIINRHWTFRARSGRAHHQAARFVVVSLSAFAFQFGLLHALLALTALDALAAQAISVLVAMPVNFLGNRIWTFETR